MQSGMLLVGLIGAVGGINVVARVVRAVTARRVLRAATASEPTVYAGGRDDWYVFFRPADLYGGQDAASTAKPVNPRQLSHPQLGSQNGPQAGVKRDVKRANAARPRVRV